LWGVRVRSAAMPLLGLFLSFGCCIMNALSWCVWYCTVLRAFPLRGTFTRTHEEKGMNERSEFWIACFLKLCGLGSRDNGRLRRQVWDIRDCLESLKGHYQSRIVACKRHQCHATSHLMLGARVVGDSQCASPGSGSILMDI
jgi:hypothetical protein